MKIPPPHYLVPILTFLAGATVGMLIPGGDEKLSEAAKTTTGVVPGDKSDAPAVPSENQGPTANEVFSATTLKPVEGEPLPPAHDGDLQAADLNTRLQAMSAAWTQMQADVARLAERVEGVERKLAPTDGPSEAVGEGKAPPTRASTLEDRRTALVTAGVTANRAADIVWRQAQMELDRLELRDIAIREGWFGSDRYREEASLIRKDALDLRAEIGEESYDRYLYAAGTDNRVEITSIIPGSSAEDAGLQAGDLVEYYGGDRIFRVNELRSATSEGERGELVQVRIRRGDEVVDAWLPRGPLGVYLDSAVVDPDA
ncbi:MAG: PDZ domain-containing protein [Chromatiaceae bacterium]|nr:PDZ domain-containing protein [Chromatiaceae bacterium]